ncbi:hypothetical protein ACFV23_39830 [Streptomyces sp. NPDC059627]
MNTPHRREPGQNSRATHDRVYALTDPQVRQAAIPVIAEGAEAVVAKARWGEAHARLEHLKGQLGATVWTSALAQVTDTDRELIALLLDGDLDQ